MVWWQRLGFFALGMLVFLNGPAWVSLVLIILALVLFKVEAELFFAGIVADLFFSSTLFGIPFIYTLSVLAVAIIIRLLKLRTFLPSLRGKE